MTLDADAEAALEQATVDVFRGLGWRTVDAYNETFGPSGTLGREDRGEVVLRPRLHAALERLNPEASRDAVRLAVEELTRPRVAVSTAAANREVYGLLKDGVGVTVRGDDGEEAVETLRVIDWDNPAHNDFLLVQQLWVTNDMYTKRPDLVGFVNGLPLVVVELKAHVRRLEVAYRDNIRDYKSTIPSLFWYNAFIILSNGSDSRVGSLTAEWDHYAPWKKINAEGEQGVIGLDTLIRGTCAPARLLDLVENFILFSEREGGLVKLVAKYHQYFGVNNAVERVRQIKANAGRLGVFWHTQGSGKSFSMAFFAQKVMRKLPGNWTFVVVTDRDDLDQQIYKNFAGVGAVTEGEKYVRADSAAHLKKLLTENHRYVFTLIQKFRTQKGMTYPVLSERGDIIVMTDEAHRSQYDIFAANMRAGLPHAGFIGFTGTPLMVGEEKTRDVFGDYVSVYNFKQSVDDGATVPLYYENRIPQLQIINPDLNEDMADLLDTADADDDAEHAVEKEFKREYQLITRDERLEKIAEDLVAHFMGRGQGGKAMVVSIDRLTAVKMYDKVQKYWRRYEERLAARLETADEAEREALIRDLAFMREADMAVIVSAAQNEVADFKAHDLDIAPHRRRTVTEDLDELFKKADSKLRIVFVCAMWMTGFDVPSCSTIYLDKPMRNHTLMQTIARANRVFGDKVNGLIVDYIGVFRDLQCALAIYAAPEVGAGGEAPVQDKSALVEELRRALADVDDFCRERGVDLGGIAGSDVFQHIRHVDELVRSLVGHRLEATLDDSVERLLVNDEAKGRFLALVARVDRLFRAILPDPKAMEFEPRRALLLMLVQKINNLSDAPDIGTLMGEVEELLDDTVGVRERFVIDAPVEPEVAHLVDLSQLDFEALKHQFETGRKRTEAEKLRQMLSGQVRRMVRLNRSRMNFADELQRMIDAYNAGASTIDAFFAQLVAFARQLSEEEQRAVAENLNEEELAIFDLLTRPEIKLSKDEEAQVKAVARELLRTLKTEKLVMDWRRKQQLRAGVRTTIRDTLDRLPAAYDAALYNQKVDAVYQHIYDAYVDDRHSIYAVAG